MARDDVDRARGSPGGWARRGAHRERIRRVRDQQARLAHSAVTHNHTLDRLLYEEEAEAAGVQHKFTRQMRRAGRSRGAGGGPRPPSLSLAPWPRELSRTRRGRMGFCVLWRGETTAAQGRSARREGQGSIACACACVLMWLRGLTMAAMMSCYSRKPARVLSS